MDSYKNAKYYFKKSLSNPNSLNDLGSYYYKIKPNFVKMEKYYILAIKKGSINAMINYGNYWRSNNNFDEMKKLLFDRQKRFFI